MIFVKFRENSSNNIAALYSLGLKEIIVLSYVLCSSIYGIVTTIFCQKGLRLSAIILQG